MRDEMRMCGCDQCSAMRYNNADLQSTLAEASAPGYRPNSFVAVALVLDHNASRLG